jgi:hypothetical protein
MRLLFDFLETTILAIFPGFLQGDIEVTAALMRRYSRLKRSAGAIVRAKQTI